MSIREHQAIVADEHPLCRAGLVSLMADRFEIGKVVQASDFSHALAALARSPCTTLMTVDFSLPGMRGAMGLRQVRSDYPSLLLVVVSESNERDVVLEALGAGVHGYILKDSPADDMIHAFEMILAGRIYVPSLVSDITNKRRAVAGRGAVADAVALTDRQLQVLRQVAAGRSNKEIARALRIAEGTVKVHITAAFRALGVHNRVNAATALHKRLRSDCVVQTSFPGLFADPRAGAGLIEALHDRRALT